MTAKVAAGSRKRAPTRGSKPGERRGGRQEGTPNKVTKALKEMILGALDDAGGQTYLKRQATENPTAFLTLLGKVLPAEVKADVKAEHTVTHRDLSDEELDRRIALLIAQR